MKLTLITSNDKIGNMQFLKQGENHKISITLRSRYQYLALMLNLDVIYFSSILKLQIVS